LKRRTPWLPARASSPLRDYEVAAPLKRLRPGYLSLTLADTPRLRSRGPIEAVRHVAGVAYLVLTPRLRSRGPIEAAGTRRTKRNSARTPRLRSRGPIEARTRHPWCRGGEPPLRDYEVAAPLKLDDARALPGLLDIDPLRDYEVAAPLKPALIVATSAEARDHSATTKSRPH